MTEAEGHVEGVELAVASVSPGPGAPYVVRFTFGGMAWTLTTEQAVTHAAAVMAAAHRADHDAAVVRQMLAVGLAESEVGELVRELRGDRRPLELDPLDLRLGVSNDGQLRPFLQVVLAGDPVGQWDVADALTHAGIVLGMAETVRLDSALSDLLVLNGLDPAKATAAVADLKQFRTV